MSPEKKIYKCNKIIIKIHFQNGMTKITRISKGFIKASLKADEIN